MTGKELGALSDCELIALFVRDPVQDMLLREIREALRGLRAIAKGCQ